MLTNAGAVRRRTPGGPPSRTLVGQRRADLRTGTRWVCLAARRAAGSSPLRWEEPMPKDKDFKKLVRTRAAKTGESYTAARSQLVRRPTPRLAPPVVCAVVGAGGRVA